MVQINYFPIKTSNCLDKINCVIKRHSIRIFVCIVLEYILDWDCYRNGQVRIHKIYLVGTIEKHIISITINVYRFSTFLLVFCFNCGLSTSLWNWIISVPFLDNPFLEFTIELSIDFYYKIVVISIKIIIALNKAYLPMDYGINRYWNYNR